MLRTENGKALDCIDWLVRSWPKAVRFFKCPKVVFVFFFPGKVFINFVQLFKNYMILIMILPFVYHLSSSTKQLCNAFRVNFCGNVFHKLLNLVLIREGFRSSNCSASGRNKVNNRLVPHQIILSACWIYLSWGRTIFSHTDECMLLIDQTFTDTLQLLDV